MSQDLRLYTLSLLIVFMLWTAPAHANYGLGAGCPNLAVPISLSDGDVWHTGDQDEGDWKDFRDLYPYNTSASVSGVSVDTFENCVVTANSGTYYDGGNHLWVLDDNLTCNFSGDEGDFRTGREY